MFLKRDFLLFYKAQFLNEGGKFALKTAVARSGFGLCWLSKQTRYGHSLGFHCVLINSTIPVLASIVVFLPHYFFTVKRYRLHTFNDYLHGENCKEYLLYI